MLVAASGRSWLEGARSSCAEGSATLTLLPMAVAGFLQANLVTDAWIAAATQALSEHLVTFDRDFKRLLAPRDLTLLDA